MGVFDEDAASGFDALNTPAGGTEQDDVPRAGVNREVLVESGDLNAIRLEDDIVESDVGDRSAVRNSDAASTTAGMEDAMDTIAKEIGAVAAAGRFDAFS